MLSMEQKRRSNCPISYCLDFVGDKWTLLIIRDILLNKKKHFKELIGSEEGIATNLLSSRLKMLVHNGFITSEVDPAKRNMKVYRITQKGKDLYPILVDMMVWSSKYGDFGEDQARLKAFAELVKNDRNSVVESINKKSS